MCANGYIFFTCFWFIEWNYVKYEKKSKNRKENCAEFAGCRKLIILFFA